jgi:hypothetical protein
MSESGDYDPGPWKGQNFSEERAKYDAHAGRSYNAAVQARRTIADLLPPSITTNSQNPLTILCDNTKSMGDRPGKIFGNCGYLDIEGKSYLGPDMETCFGVFGDVFSDTYPVQARPFTHGLDMQRRLLELVIESKGGPGICESSETAALYAARNIHTPRAVRRNIVIMITDEMPYDFVDPDTAKKFANVILSARISTKDIFTELMEKSSLYMIRSPWFKKTGTPTDNLIKDRWCSLLGESRVAELPSVDGIQDVIFGILAVETNKMDYFAEEIKNRQEPSQIANAYKSLSTIFAAAKARLDSGANSTTPNDGARSRSLMDM